MSELPLVTGDDLLKLLFSSASRPNLDWLERERRRGAIPSIRINGNHWYDPIEVREALGRLVEKKAGAR